MTTAFNHALLKLTSAIPVGLSRNNVITFPIVLLPRDRFLLAKTASREHYQVRQTAKVAPSAELIRDVLWQLGMRSERVRMDGEGMLALFRRMMHPAPWVTVQPDDCDGQLSDERSKELTPLYLLNGSEDSLIRQFEDFHRERQLQLQFLHDPVPEILAQVERISPMVLEAFISELRLARALGPETFEKLCDLIFNLADEFRASPGVPDLFIWDSDQHPLEWFFAEVKGPGDSLRGSQAAWLRDAWRSIEGHFALIMVA
jgi:hypothetical protein